jgi:hypothetical protein
MLLMNRFFSAVALVVLAFTLAASAQDRETCSNSSLHGSFGLRATGNTTTSGCASPKCRPSKSGGIVSRPSPEL